MSSEIKRVAVLGGGGLIGSGWITNFIWRGLPVNVYDISEEALNMSRARVKANLEYLVAKEVMPAGSMNVALSLVKHTTNMKDAVSGVSFIQEASPEKYEVKQALLSEVDRFAAPDAIFASSTSGLLITEIARGSKNPERCVGAHPYNPPHLIPLVEISRGEATSEDTVSRAYAFYKTLGKEPIILQK